VHNIEGGDVDDRVLQSLQRDRTIDITTIGRTSGSPHRIETWFHRVDGGFYLTGTPGRRDWYANLLANPRFTFHLKESVAADLLAQAAPITEPAERRAVFASILHDLDHEQDLEAWVADSPLVAVTFDEPGTVA
jgi:hypothetical protein